MNNTQRKLRTAFVALANNRLITVAIALIVVSVFAITGVYAEEVNIGQIEVLQDAVDTGQGQTGFLILVVALIIIAFTILAKRSGWGWLAIWAVVALIVFGAYEVTAWMANR